MGKTRASNKKTPVTVSKTSKSKNKRLLDEDEDIEVTRVQVDSGDEMSEVQKSVQRDGVPAKRTKYGISFINEELESRFKQLDLGSRRIIFGRPIAGTSYARCGALNCFTKLGFHSFINDLPRECYPSYVYEFYANLIVEQPGLFVSYVRGQRITLNVPVLSSILSIDQPSNVSIGTKKGPTELPNFTELDQLKVIRGMDNLLEYIPPTTTSVTPLAHVLFKMCIDNVNPRTGTRSNFSGQDVSVVAMLLSEKPFNMAGLILKNMMDVFESNSAPLPYGCMLTRVFKWYGINLKDEDCELAKELLDAKSLLQSHLKLNSDDKVIRMDPPPPPPPVTPRTPPSSLMVSANVVDMDHSDHFKEIKAALKVLTDKVTDMADEITFLRDLAAGPRASTSTRTGPHSTVSGANVAAADVLKETDDSQVDGDKENDDNVES